MSRRPYSLLMNADAAAHDSSDVTSSSTKTAPPPRTARSPSGARTSAITTRAPSAAKSSAWAMPRPPRPPVLRATRPASRSLTGRASSTGHRTSVGGWIGGRSASVVDRQGRHAVEDLEELGAFGAGRPRVLLVRAEVAHPRLRDLVAVAKLAVEHERDLVDPVAVRRYVLARLGPVADHRQRRRVQ